MDNRTFKDVVKTIKKSEKDVDKVLDAARLERKESGKMDRYKFDAIMETIMLIAAMLIPFASFIILVLATK